MTAGLGKIMVEAGLNVFLFHAREIPGSDLLSDSGTTTMEATGVGRRA